MRVSAILVVNSQPGVSSLGAQLEHESRAASRVPLSCIDILGRSVLEQTIARFQQAGIRTISVIGGAEVRALAFHRDIEVTIAENPFARWPAAQKTVSKQRMRGIETVIVVGVASYVESSVADALEFHRTKSVPLIQLEDCEGIPLDFWVVDTNWFTTAANGCTLPFRYGEFPGLPVPCRMNGYVNLLATGHDLRQLVVAAFLGRCEMRPQGTEVRPGVWVDDGARVHKRSRLVAPVYVGRSARVEASAVITRFSNVEREAHIGSGTVVDQASVLPHTAVGSGLNLSHSIVNGDTLFKLDQNIALQIDDPNLIAPTLRRSPGPDQMPRQLEGAAEFQCLGLLSRAAGRFSEVFFKG